MHNFFQKEKVITVNLYFSQFSQEFSFFTINMICCDLCTIKNHVNNRLFILFLRRNNGLMQKKCCLNLIGLC